MGRVSRSHRSDGTVHPPLTCPAGRQDLSPTQITRRTHTHAHIIRRHGMRPHTGQALGERGRSGSDQPSPTLALALALATLAPARRRSGRDPSSSAVGPVIVILSLWTSDRHRRLVAPLGAAGATGRLPARPRTAGRVAWMDAMGWEEEQVAGAGDSMRCDEQTRTQTRTRTQQARTHRAASHRIASNCVGS